MKKWKKYYKDFMNLNNINKKDMIDLKYMVVQIFGVKISVLIKNIEIDIKIFNLMKQIKKHMKNYKMKYKKYNKIIKLLINFLGKQKFHLKHI